MQMPVSLYVYQNVFIFSVFDLILVTQSGRNGACHCFLNFSHVLIQCNGGLNGGIIKDTHICQLYIFF